MFVNKPLASPTNSGNPGPVIRLHGYSISNYYNRIKMALRLKGLLFDEVRAAPSREPAYLQLNPLGLIPTLEIDGVFLAETHPILEYLDEAFPDATRLFPQAALDRHRVRQLVNYVDIHIDRPLRVLRNLHSNGTEDSSALKALVLNEIANAVAGINSTAKFSPYIAGNEISAADLAAYCTIPWFSELALRHIGEDPLKAIQGFAEYKAFMDQNPDFAEIHASAAKQIRILERAKKIAGGRPSGD